MSHVLLFIWPALAGFTVVIPLQWPRFPICCEILQQSPEKVLKSLFESIFRIYDFISRHNHTDTLALTICTVKPLLRGHPDERPSPLERPLDNVNLNILDSKCIDFYPWQEATPLERPLFWCKRGGLTRGVPLYFNQKSYLV